MNSIKRFLTTRVVQSGAALFLLPLAAFGQSTIDFDDLDLSSESYYNGSDQAGGFSSGGASFNNQYDTEWDTWGGWSYSNVTDTTTPTFSNQYAAITGAGLGDTSNYAVAYVDTFSGAIPRIVLPEDEFVQGIHVTNTAYAYYSMRDGDSFSKQFGGASGDDPDFFRLTVTGLTATETSVGSVDFYLADYRSADNELDTLLDDWAWIDLSTFGEEVRVLEFTLESSDAGIWGMNTPAYFALGDVAVIPEPATGALWGGMFAGASIFLLRRRSKRNSRQGFSPGRNPD